MEDDDRPKLSNLQQWIEQYGAYWKIPRHEWDAANAKYQDDRRAYLGGPLSKADRTAINRRHGDDESAAGRFLKIRPNQMNSEWRI